jgi:putative membrane protein
MAETAMLRNADPPQGALTAVQVTDVQIPALRSIAGPKVVAAIALLSVALLGFLVWLLYVKQSAGHTSAVVAALPAVNASMNALSSIFLVTAYVAVRRRNYARHIRFIFAALGSSTLFFVGYVVYHNFHGDTKFLGTGVVRPLYFFVLITHIVLSAVVVPMVLTSLYLALSGKLATHRRVSRFTFPIWLYVSLTGVLIFVMLKAFNPS